jgi:hypothetical protein
VLHLWDSCSLVAGRARAGKATSNASFAMLALAQTPQAVSQAPSPPGHLAWFRSLAHCCRGRGAPTHQGCPVGSGEQTAHGQRSFGAGPPVHGSMSTPCARRGNISTNHGLGRLTAAPSARIRPRACEKRAARCRASSSFTRRDETEHLDPTIPSAATGTWLAQRAFPVPAVL